MSSFVATGYASLDYPVSIDGYARPNETTLVETRNPRDWPRIGGCPIYVAAAVANGGFDAAPICWTGDNPEGEAFVSAAAALGLDTRGIEKIASERSPSSLLIYQADGSCICLYDPALGHSQQLTDRQADMIAEAGHLCITVGPPHLMEPILSRCRDTTRLYWVLKNDAHCFTPQIRAVLSARADVIFCNRHERDLIARRKPDAIIVETRGVEGVAVETDGMTTIVEARTVGVSDTTGAGDTFAGGFIAAMMSGNADPVEAAKAGTAAVFDLLSKRCGRSAR
jgi:ribokinase